MQDSRVSDCRNAVPTIRRVVYTEYTPTACMTYKSLLTSTDHMAQGSMLKSHCIIFVRRKESVIWSAMSSPCWSLPHLLTSHLPTTHHLDRTIFSETTLYTNNHFRKNLSRLFQKLLHRKAALKNHSLTSIMRVPETSAQTLPQEVGEEDGVSNKEGVQVSGVVKGAV